MDRAQVEAENQDLKDRLAINVRSQFEQQLHKVNKLKVRLAEMERENYMGHELVVTLRQLLEEKRLRSKDLEERARDYAMVVSVTHQMEEMFRGILYRAILCLISLCLLLFFI